MNKGGDGQGHSAVKFISSTDVLVAFRDIKKWDLRSQAVTSIINEYVLRLRAQRAVRYYHVIQHAQCAVRSARTIWRIWTVLIILFSETRENAYIQSLSAHPDQPHIIAAGSTDGSLTIWDTRKSAYPLTKLKAHRDDGMFSLHRNPRIPTQVLVQCSRCFIQQGAEMWTAYRSLRLARHSILMLQCSMGRSIPPHFPRKFSYLFKHSSFTMEFQQNPTTRKKFWGIASRRGKCGKFDYFSRQKSNIFRV